MADSHKETVINALEAEMARLLNTKGGCRTTRFALLAACHKEITRLRSLIDGIKRHINDSADGVYDDEFIVGSYIAMGYDQEVT